MVLNQLTIYRKAESSSPGAATHPGMVDEKALKIKLSKHLKIDLEDHEKIVINKEPVEFDEIDNNLDALMETIQDEDVEIRNLGDYIAKITLDGGYSVPLKFLVTNKR